MQEPKRIVEKKLRAKAAAEQGVALLMVLICLAIIMPFTATFNMEARVDWQAAVNAGDEVKARNVHRGATRLSLLLFELQRRPVPGRPPGRCPTGRATARCSGTASARCRA